MEVKLLLILLLVIVLGLNYYTYERFNPMAEHIKYKLKEVMNEKNYYDLSHHTNQLSVDEQKRGIIKTNKLKEFSKTPNWYLERGTFSLTLNKILITLFYDPNDRFSRMFYDDTEKVYEDYMSEKRRR